LTQLHLGCEDTKSERARERESERAREREIEREREREGVRKREKVRESEPIVRRVDKTLTISRERPARSAKPEKPNQRIVRERRALVVSLTVPQSEQRREANVLRISPLCVGEPRVPPASPAIRAR